MADFTLSRTRYKSVFFAQTTAAKKWLARNISSSVFQTDCHSIDREFEEEFIQKLLDEGLTTDD